MQNLVNHIIFAIDRSGSMQFKPVVKVFDALLKRLKNRSIETGQETRISILLFDDKIDFIAYDMDVMRFETLAGNYTLGGMTALIDAAYQAITEHQDIPTRHGNHAFLCYVLTDGGENSSSKRSHHLETLINKLADNWTIACFVPDADGVHEAKKFGFPSDAIAVWNVNASDAMEGVGRRINDATDNFMTMRSKGVRGTKGLFTLDTSGLNKRTVSAELDVIKPATYELLNVRPRDVGKEIRTFVNSWMGEDFYTKGCAYYQPTKTVEVQGYKGVLIQDRKTGKVYGGDNARQLLGLPDHTVKVNPGDHKDFRLFIQSTSTNRHIDGEFVLVMK